MRVWKLLGFALLVVLVLLGASTLYLTVGAKPRLQAAASDALGMEVKIGGAVHVGLLPLAHLSLGDVHFGIGGAEFASVGHVDVGVEILPALQHRIRINRIGLRHLRILLERDRDGRLNLDRPAASGGTLPELTVDKVSVSNATVLYTDRTSNSTLEARDCRIDLSHLRLQPGRREEWLRKLSFAADLSCAELQTKNFTASRVTATLHATAAVLSADPFGLRLFGGEGRGAIRADYSNSTPSYRARYHLAAFHLDELFKVLSAKAIGQGSMDFAAELSSQGDTMAELKRTVSGHATLRGDNLTLQIGDLDKRLARFESTQNFDLVDAGAFFFAGPIGLSVTKGYDFARVFRDTGGSTSIRELVSEWSIEHGLGHATDVALATPQNRVALKGDLDFATGELDQVTVALIDAQGCSKAEQNVHGPFLHPQIEIPTIIKALAGPTRRLFGKAQSLFGKKCQPFYTGSVTASK
jgi:uncharacterized protein involved in outer membrane biogenesis